MPKARAGRLEEKFSYSGFAEFKKGRGVTLVTPFSFVRLLRKEGGHKEPALPGAGGTGFGEAKALLRIAGKIERHAHGCEGVVHLLRGVRQGFKADRAVITGMADC